VFFGENLPAAGSRVPGLLPSEKEVFSGENLLTAGSRRLRAVRGGGISMIFQEPMTSLNPVFTVGRQMTEVVRLHTGAGRIEAKNICRDFLAAVKLPDPETVLGKYPHQLSGGQRQRVMIAMALSSGPELLIADEPTTALDVTVQSQVLALLNDLTRARGVSTLFITHDLGVVAQLCDRVAVMYSGHLVELAPVESLFNQPAHPYTRGHLAAIPSLGNPRTHLPAIPGQVPNPADPPPGCRFHPRCGHRLDQCLREAPALTPCGEHWTACHNQGPGRP
jgi:peptide/nickel transport system ATP-binding protein